MDNFCKSKALHWLLSLCKIRKFHLISRWPKICRNGALPENFLTGKFGKISVFYALYTRIWKKLYEQQKAKNAMKTLSSIIHLRCVRFASHCSRGLDKLASPFFTENASFLDGPFFTENFESSTPIQNLKKTQILPTFCKRQQFNYVNGSTIK